MGKDSEITTDSKDSKDSEDKVIEPKFSFSCSSSSSRKPHPFKKFFKSKRMKGKH